MDNERRGGSTPLPGHLNEFLNEMQLLELRNIEKFGWTLRYVRRPLFQEIVPIVFSPDGESFAVIGKDGHLNRQPDITIRA